MPAPKQAFRWLRSTVFTDGGRGGLDTGPSRCWQLLIKVLLTSRSIDLEPVPERKD